MLTIKVLRDREVIAKIDWWIGEGNPFLEKGIHMDALTLCGGVPVPGISCGVTAGDAELKLIHANFKLLRAVAQPYPYSSVFVGDDALFIVANFNALTLGEVNADDSDPT